MAALLTAAGGWGGAGAAGTEARQEACAFCEETKEVPPK